jgi:putative nucleotidyltransferase with HDIG domain
MSIDVYQKVLEDHKELASLPQTLAEVIRVTKDDRSSAQDLANIILHDPGLTTKVLRIVNSPFYGARREITTLTQAVVTLGMRAVSALALSTSIYDLTGKWQLTIDRLRFWRHSLEVAIGARLIAQQGAYPHPEEAFIAGLLHDIGILVLEKSFPEKYERLWKETISGEKLYELEEKTWGTNHAKVGQFLLEQWHLPSVLTEAVGHHHLELVGQSAEPDLRLTQVVALANRLAQFTIGKTRPEHNYDPETRDGLARALGIDGPSLQKIHEILVQKTVEEARLLEINIGTPEDILIEANRLIYNQYLTVENLLREKQEMQQEIARTKLEKAALETLKTISATFNHYINNAAATILGRAQLVELGIKSGDVVDKNGSAEMAMGIIVNGVATITMVMDELKNLSKYKTTVYHDDTYILDIEDKVKRRLEDLRRQAMPVS